MGWEDRADALGLGDTPTVASSGWEARADALGLGGAGAPVSVGRGAIGLSGPGSQDPDPSGSITTPEPSSVPGALKQIGVGALGSLQSAAHGVNTLVGEALPADVVGPNGFQAPTTAKLPFAGLTDPAKRRELERGVSDATTLGLAEKVGNWVDPAFAATAAPDAAAAPGYREAGVVGGSFLPNPIADVAAGAAKKVAPVLTAPLRKLVGAPAVEAAEGTTAREATGAFARSDKRIIDAAEDGSTIKLGSKIKEKGDELVSVVRRNPDLQAALPSAPKRAAEAEKILTSNNEQMDGIYRTADALSPPIGQSAVVDEFAAAAKAAKAGKNKPLADAIDALQAKHLYDAPDATWSSKEIRRLVSDLQDTAFNVGPAAEPTPVRQAAADVAGRLKDALESHVERATNVVADIGKDGKTLATADQLAQLNSIQGQFTIERLRQLNADSTALIRLKKAAEYAATRNNGNRLSKIAESKVAKVLHYGALVGAVPSHGASLLPIVAMHAAPAVIRTADEGLRAIAIAASKSKRVPTDLIAAAVRAGASRPTIAALMTHYGAQEGTDAGQ